MGIYEKPTANIILSGKILSNLPLISGTKQGCSFSLAFDILQEILAMQKGD